MLDKIIDWAIPLVCGSVLTYCVTWYRMTKRKNTALEDGVVCLCNRDTGNPVYNALADFVGIYVSVVE